MQKAVVCSFKFIANNISALSYKSVEVKAGALATGALALLAQPTSARLTIKLRSNLFIVFLR